MILKLLTNLSFYIPEVLSIVVMLTLLIVEALYSRKEKDRTLVYVVGLIGLVLVLFSLVKNLSVPATSVFADAVVIDAFGTFAKIIMVLGTMGAIYISWYSKDIYKTLKSEFVIMAMGVLIGGMLLASANNMLTTYLGVETLSILSYVMATLKREDSLSSEAGLKYVLYGGVTAGVMLFGISHIYGALGTIQFNEIVTQVQTLEGAKLWLVLASFLMVFAGLGYKISCFPFHMWSPDVYQGSPVPVTAFFSIVPKIAGLAIVVRITMIFFGQSTVLSQSWMGLIHVIAALTMTVGNVSAINQDSVKRMLAFSSIGHVGMMLLGVVVLDELGIRAILFYGITYLFMTIVAFAITAHLSDKFGGDSQSYFKGLVYKHPFMAIAMALTLFSLAGMPPFSGFVAKFNIMSVVINKGHYSLAFIAAINSVIALYYYLKLVKYMIVSKPESQESIESFGFVNQLVIVLIALPVLFLGIFWEKIMLISGGAKIFIQ